MLGASVRVSFATNDERTAKRVSDALGTATEMRAMKNYAGHRLSPWLGHLMVSRQETARPLLTPGEVMQLPPNDELVLVSGVPPIRAKKARYFEDPRLTERVLAPPAASEQGGIPSVDDWSLLSVPTVSSSRKASSADEKQTDDPANGGIRREPELPQHEEIVPEQAKPAPEFVFGEEDPDDDAVRVRVLRQQARGLARQVAMDPGDGLEL
jgi:type IV secretion system protein VirD4